MPNIFKCQDILKQIGTYKFIEIFLFLRFIFEPDKLRITSVNQSLIQLILSVDKIFKLSALCQLGDSYQDSGEYDKAIAAYRDILKDYPDSIYNDYIQYQIALTWLKSGNTDSAIVALRKLIKEFPESQMIDDANYYLAVIDFQKGDFVSAREQLELFRNRYKDSGFRHQALFLLGETLLNLEEYRSAVDVFAQLLKDNDVADSLRQKSEYEIANAYHQMGQEKEANKRLSDFVARYPDSSLTPNVLFEMGEASRQSRDNASARKYFERLIRNYPENEFAGEAYIAIGETFLSDGNKSSALRSFRQARENGRLESAAKASLLAGDVFLQDKDYAQARGFYEDALSLQTSWNKSALIRLARVYQQEKKYREAIQALEKAVQIEGADKDSGIQFMIAENWEEAGDADRAVEAYLKVHYLFPQDREISAKALLRVARIYEDREDWSEARKVLEKVAALDVAEAKYAKEKLSELEKNEAGRVLTKGHS